MVFLNQQIMPDSYRADIFADIFTELEYDRAIMEVHEEEGDRQ